MIAMLLTATACVRSPRTTVVVACEGQLGTSAIERRLASSREDTPSGVGSLVVRVAYAQDTVVRPIAEARLLLTPAATMFGAEQSSPVSTNAEGVGRFGLVRVGTYVLSSRAIGFAGRRDTVVVRERYTDTIMVSLRTDVIRDFCLR